jgi:general stress protein 26
MSEPVTDIDSRFSDPGVAVTGWDSTRELIEAAELFWICTVRADGRPHITPLVAVWLDGALHFSTGAAEQKALNLQSNQQVILMTGCNSWESGADVVFEGEAVQVSDDGMLQRLADAWRAKWDGRWQFEARDGSFHQGNGPALVFSVIPAKVLVFGKGSFSQTRHTF